MRNFTIATIILFAIGLVVFVYAFVFYQQPLQTNTEIEQHLISTQNSENITTNHYVGIGGEVDRIDRGDNQFIIAMLKDSGDAFNYNLPFGRNIILRQCTPDARCPDFSSYTGNEVITNGYIFREFDPELIEAGDRIDIFQTRVGDRQQETVYLTRYQEIINE